MSIINKATVFTRNRSALWLAAILIVILVANAFFLRFNAFRGFFHSDMAPFLDVAWRILCGQRLYVDFIFPEGPMHVDMMVFFFRIFGFGKFGILAHLIVINSLVTFAVFLILRRRVPFVITAAVTALTAPSFYWAISHPWHDQSAHFWGIWALVLFLGSEPGARVQKSWIRYWACGCLATFALLAKTNIGLMYVGLFFLASWTDDRRGKALGIYAGGVLTGCLISLWLIGAPGDFWQQHMFLIQALKGRLAGHGGNLQIWFQNYYWIPVLVILVNTLTSHKRLRTVLVLFYGISLMAVMALISGSMRVPANILLWGIQMALAFIVLEQEKTYLNGQAGAQTPELTPVSRPDRMVIWRRRLSWASTIFLLALTLLETMVAVQRGIELKAWYRDQGVKDSQYYRLQAAPLSGWLMQSREGWILDQVTAFIKTTVPPQDSILNLTDLYIIYSLTGRQSYKGITYCIVSGTLPAAGKQTEQIKRNILAHLPDWIIIREDSFNNELRDLNLSTEVVGYYRPVVQLGDVLILKRNVQGLRRLK